MTSSSQERNAGDRTVEWYLAVGCTTFVVSVDVWLFFAGRGVGRIQLRLGLAALAFGVVGVCFVGAIRRTIHPAAVVLGFPLAVIYSYTGLIIPWTQLSYFVGQLTLEILLSMPLLGEPLATLIFGGFTLSLESLRTAFHVHHAVLVLVIIILLYGIGRKLWSHKVTSRVNPDEDTVE